MNRPRDPHTLDQIVDMLRARIAALVWGVWQLREGHREGHDWVCPNPLRADRTAKSFRIALSGPYQGLIKDFAGPFIKGKDSCSALTFHAELCHGGDTGAAVKWAKAWLGLDGTNPEALRSTQQALHRYDDRPEQDEATVERKRNAAKRIYFFDGVEASVLGTPVATYLRGRGIHLAALDFPVRALRWKPECPLGRDQRRPAMLAPIVRPISAKGGSAKVGPQAKDVMVGVHRTFLEEDGDGRWIKARDLKDAKLSLGSYAGGAIRLWNGIRIDPDTGEIKYGRRINELKEPVIIDVTEGIEDALSVVVACPEARVWCGVSLSNMAGLILPEVVAGVRFWRQNDPPDSPAARAFERACVNTHRQGRQVFVVELPPEWKDANDVLQGAER